jgi:hypothetical protein
MLRTSSRNVARAAFACIGTGLGINLQNLILWLFAGGCVASLSCCVVECVSVYVRLSKSKGYVVVKGWYHAEY